MEQLVNPARRRLFKGRIAQQPKIDHLRLPWVVSEEVFSEKCTSCDNCIIACETNILVKDENGLPKIDFTRGECTFCQQCIDSCEQPLFKPQEDYKQHLAWPATINIEHNCLAENNIYCQSCRDECEPDAITFNFVSSSIPVPKINPDDCTLCGACISTCPQQSIKITIEKETVNV